MYPIPTWLQCYTKSMDFNVLSNIYQSLAACATQALLVVAMYG